MERRPPRLKSPVLVKPSESAARTVLSPLLVHGRKSEAGLRVCGALPRPRRVRRRRGLLSLIRRYVGNDLLPSLMWTILDIIIAGATAGFLLLIALIIRQ